MCYVFPFFQLECVVDLFDSMKTELVVSKLNDAISHPSTLIPDYRMETDNAISALCKICEHQRDCINASQVFIILYLRFPCWVISSTLIWLLCVGNGILWFDIYYDIQCKCFDFMKKLSSIVQLGL